jgi:beta-xylosidase
MECGLMAGAGNHRDSWGISYPYPVAPHPLKPHTGVDTFSDSALGPEWEWNHNPDNTRWTLNDGLRLQTATVTNDLYLARNTVNHRIPGPQSTATIALDFSRMKDNDRAGPCAAQRFVRVDWRQARW